MFGFLFFLGGGLFLIGIGDLFRNRKNLARRSRVRAIPTAPVSQATGGLVEIKGHIVPGEDGPAEAPLSERQVVWARVTVKEAHGTRGNDPGITWKTLVDEITSTPFFVDDKSGEMVRILPQGANVLFDKRSHAGSGPFNDASPHLEAFLQSHDLSSKNLRGLNKSLSVTEEVLAPGDALYALGPSRREPGPPASEGSGLAAPSQLVMYADPGGHGELILTNKPEEQLESHLTWRFVSGLACACAGALIAGGVLVFVYTSG